MADETNHQTPHAPTFRSHPMVQRLQRHALPTTNDKINVGFLLARRYDTSIGVVALVWAEVGQG